MYYLTPDFQPTRIKSYYILSTIILKPKSFTKPGVVSIASRRRDLSAGGEIYQSVWCICVVRRIILLLNQMGSKGMGE